MALQIYNKKIELIGFKITLTLHMASLQVPLTYSLINKINTIN